MSRQLKFRAWSESEKQMYYATPYRGYIKSNGSLWELYNGDDVVVASSVYDDKLMQCTELKDKNGVLIYEGDVVEATRYDGLAVTGVVDFRDCSFVINTGYQTIYTWIDYQIEVIGNVYNNKELLEEIENDTEDES